MRRALLALLILTAAGPAAALQVQKPKVSTSVLPSRDPPATILVSPWALEPRQPSGDLHRCNAMCSRNRFFCETRNADNAGCGGDWVLCNRQCASAYATTPFGR